MSPELSPIYFLVGFSLLKNEYLKVEKIILQIRIKLHSIRIERDKKEYDGIKMLIEKLNNIIGKSDLLI